MKYIVVALDGVESIFTFPRSVDHDRMYEAITTIRFGHGRNWDRKYMTGGHAVSAGFVDGGGCHGFSETLGIGSRGAADTELLAAGGGST